LIDQQKQAFMVSAAKKLETLLHLLEKIEEPSIDQSFISCGLLALSARPEKWNDAPYLLRFIQRTNLFKNRKKRNFLKPNLVRKHFSSPFQNQFNNNSKKKTENPFE